ncbi:uncharacterized protein C8A04DRAFT_30224 [Dichotomopilus funicola]|uniref:FAD-binding domain-containing protein n=1 Tax=Dichotomopilus funicola TaxID=1934379 RepID=A0AAN6V113_9PEZI|nr:hypothetical protein C8A04DRAFT_30224 [Dichotomopilus funicola]
MPPLRILINGGGIAGHALAFWLARLRTTTPNAPSITVVERFPNLRATGLQLDLRSAGLEVLRRMGPEREQLFKAMAAPEQGMQVVDKKGRRRALFPVRKGSDSKKQAQSLTSEFEIMRGDLCRGLYDATRAVASSTPTPEGNPPPVQYLYNTSIASLTPLPTGQVSVTFTTPTNPGTDNHPPQTYDLVIGADGQWSRTRQLLFPDLPNTGMRRIPGYHIAYFTMPRPMAEGETEFLATTYVAPGRRGYMVRRHSPDEVQVMMTYMAPPKNHNRGKPNQAGKSANPDENDEKNDPLTPIPRGDTPLEKATLTHLFTGAGWITPDILAGMEKADDFYLERLGLVQIPAWSRGRVVLVGDAAYCPTVLSGMGTTCAMVGAYVLAGEIGEYIRRAAGDGNEEEGGDGLERALKRYEERFRPFVEGMQEGIEERAEGQWAMTGSAFGIGVLNLMVGVASLLRVNVAAMFGIRETVKGWELPVYEGLWRD